MVFIYQTHLPSTPRVVEEFCDSFLMDHNRGVKLSFHPLVAVFIFLPMYLIEDCLKRQFHDPYDDCDEAQEQSQPQYIVSYLLHICGNMRFGSHDFLSSLENLRRKGRDVHGFRVCFMDLLKKYFSEEQRLLLLSLRGEVMDILDVMNANASNLCGAAMENPDGFLGRLTSDVSLFEIHSDIMRCYEKIVHLVYGVLSPL